MDETKLRTIAQLQEFLAATAEIKFTSATGDDDTQRYAHISRVLKRLNYLAAFEIAMLAGRENQPGLGSKFPLVFGRYAYAGRSETSQPSLQQLCTRRPGRLRVKSPKRQGALLLSE